jgi:UDP-N-acetylglucosamine 2-epimerase
LAYLDFLMLMDNSAMILSDSGGIQKEAYILQKPCVTLRSETEWVETVTSGWNLLLDPSSRVFPAAISGFKVPQEHPEIFGRDVAQVILEVIEQA